jgi:hypothetical protein
VVETGTSACRHGYRLPAGRQGHGHGHELSLDTFATLNGK